MKATPGAASPSKEGTLTWVLIAVVCLGGVLLVWLGHAAARERAIFGPSVSVAVLSAALAGTAIGGACVVALRPAARGLRWAVALLLAVLAGGVECVTLSGLFAPRDGLDIGVGILSALAGSAIVVVAARLTRR